MERQIALEGCHNFRDLGGYPAAEGRRVRWRLLFRSDGLQDLTPGDIGQLRRQLAIGDVIDLRSSAELRHDGRGLLGEEPLRFHHLPLFDGGGSGQRPPPDATLAELYLGMLENAREPIAAVLSALAAAPGPAVFHCAAGKDRTGLVSALLLELLGVAPEVIVADYAATRENLDAIVARLTSSRGYERVFEDLPPDSLHAEPQTMVTLLEGVAERYGSARAYALGSGVSEEAVERLCARLLE